MVIRSNKPQILKPWHRTTPIVIECKVCNENFEHWNYQATMTCSKGCADNLMTKTRKEEGSFIRTEEAIEKSLKTKFGTGYQRRHKKECLICGIEFWVRASQRERRKTCSKKCMGIYNSLYISRGVRIGTKGPEPIGKGSKQKKPYVSTSRFQLSFVNGHRVVSLEQREHLSKVRKERGLSKGKNNPNYGGGCHHPTARGCGGYRKDIGHFVRSVPEANYARILQYEDIKYKYEHMRYPIVRENGVEQTFCPDFYLIKEDRYIEIKGFEKEDSMQKYECFKRQYPHISICMIKSPSEEWKQLKHKYDHTINWEYSPSVMKQRNTRKKET